MDTATQVKFRPLKADFGAEILDVDIKHADEATLDSVVAAFQAHGAILLRDQSLEPADLMRFIERFGEPEDHTLVENTLPGFPKIYVLSNRVDENGKPIGAHNDGIGWHTDYSYKSEPVMSTMLYAVETPPVGSDTLLADLCKAWNALPPERQAELDGKMVHHSWLHFMATRDFNRMENPSEELKADNPDVYHPLVRTHPSDGRKALFVSTGTVKGIVGMPNPEGLELMDELIEFATQDEFVFRHKWREGDVLMWDNRCTLHTGTLYDDTKYFRLMHRLWVKGDKPY
ncbi:MAG TPA: TauD/TfdA family dioxygenase [Caulobacteraceae bacterium]|jgi:taurine dioxygenase|nr:TauD/TfdA family dioxygenase [Caulobacteraceae bacterium]